MPEAVIVDAIRTPIGRAVKGSLKDVRADDLAAVPLRALVERNPGVDFAETVDVMMGCGFGCGEQGYNVGRNATLLAGFDHHIPACTRQPLLRVLAADAADGLPRDQGGRGRPVHRRRRRGRLALRPAATRRADHPQLDGSDGSLYNVYIPMGLTAENVAERCDVSREAAGRVGGHLAGPRGRGARRPATSTPRSSRSRPTARSRATTARARARRWRSSPSSSRCSRRGRHVTAGNSCPLNDGAAAVLVMTAEKAASARPQAAGADRRLDASPRSGRRSWASARSRRSRRCSSRPG